MDGLARRQKITLAEGIEVGAVDGEEGEAAVELVEFVQVDGEQEDPVEKPVGPRGETRVHDVALVEAGIHAGRRKHSGKVGTGKAGTWTLLIRNGEAMKPGDYLQEEYRDRSEADPDGLDTNQLRFGLGIPPVKTNQVFAGQGSRPRSWALRL